MSAKNHAAELEGIGVLVGTGDRVVKLGFVTINVYSMGLYVDADACRDALLDRFSGQDHDTLLQSPDFFSAFVSGNFRKTFKLKFCRTLSQAKLVAGFEQPLRSRCDPSHEVDCESLLGALVPEDGVDDNDVLTVICDGDMKTLRATFAKAGGPEQKLIELESGGAGGTWEAFQNLYFDSNTAIPTIRHSAISDLPDVLVAPGDATLSLARKPTMEEIERAVEEGFAQQKRFSWSEFAGRDVTSDEADGYQFGDITRGVFTKLGFRKHASSGTVEESSGRLEPSDDDELVRKNHELAEQNHELAERCKVLQAEIQSKQLRVTELEQAAVNHARKLPFIALAVIVIVEILLSWARRDPPLLVYLQ